MDRLRWSSVKGTEFAFGKVSNAKSVLWSLSTKEKAKQYTENLMPQMYKTQIKIQRYPGLA